MSDSLTGLVKKWMSIEEEIKEHSVRTKELREENSNLNERIIEAMNNMDIDMCKLNSGGALVLKKQMKYSSVNKELIEDTLKGVFKVNKEPGDPDKLASETTEAIFNGREATETQVLRKVKTK